MNDRDFAIRKYGYPPVLSCERCGRVIYQDDEYRRSGYGGFLCGDCINDDDFEEEYEDADSES